jgi:hypothetical protein
MEFTKILYHQVFSTKKREPVLRVLPATWRWWFQRRRPPISCCCRWGCFVQHPGTPCATPEGFQNISPQFRVFEDLGGRGIKTPCQPRTGLHKNSEFEKMLKYGSRRK